MAETWCRHFTCSPKRQSRRAAIPRLGAACRRVDIKLNREFTLRGQDEGRKVGLVKFSLTMRAAMSRTVQALAMTAFFAVLALDISVPAIVLLGLLAVRELGLDMGTLI